MNTELTRLIPTLRPDGQYVTEFSNGEVFDRGPFTSWAQARDWIKTRKKQLQIRCYDGARYEKT